MGFEIDPQYVDVDFARQPEYVFGDLGGAMCGFKRFEDSFPVWTPSKIAAVAERIDATDTGADQFVGRIYNQKNEGSCVGNASCQGIENLQGQTWGVDKIVPMSAISLYKRIGSSPNSGATISGAYRELTSRGALPLDTPENRARFGGKVMPHVGYYEPFPSDWEPTAAQFALDEAVLCNSVDAIFTAMGLRFPVLVGREGHSVLYVRLLPGRRVLYVNSWGEWGQAAGRHPYGFGVDTERQIKKSASYAVALLSLRQRRAP
jgi:hypothetical protein